MNEDYKDYLCVSDLEIEYSNFSLETFDEILSEQEEQLLSQINEFQQQIDDSHDLMYDLMEAVKKGAIDYVNAMTDTGETFSLVKNPVVVNNLKNVEIDKRCKPVDAVSNANWQTRNMADAKENPFDKNVIGDTNGMSAAGKAKFKMYKEAYSQRLKTNTITSNGEGNTIETRDPVQNLESLSGLRNYRIGPVIPMPNIETIKKGYENAVAEGKAESAAGYIRKQNFEAFDNALVERFGFKSKAEAKRWRESNHLTIHETGDGMYLIPTDVHDSSSHMGYCSKLSDILKGKEGAEKDMQLYIREEKIAYIKHEAKVRGIRTAQGVGLSIVKDLMKHAIANLVTSFYEERKLIQEQGFATYIKTVMSACWKKIKTKTMNILKNIGANISGAIATELLNALNDFLLGIFKRLFSVIRQMFASIRNAYSVLRSKGYSWQEKIYEAAKILSAGAVAILGFSLNEIIEKGLLSMAIPANIASFIAECLAGLFAGIFSNIVLMLFDHTKGALKVRDTQLQLSLLRSQSIFVNELRTNITVLKSSRDLCNTFHFFGDIICEIKQTRDNIKDIKDRTSVLNEETRTLIENNSIYNEIANKYKDENF